jgi:hypothetical protein
MFVAGKEIASSAFGLLAMTLTFVMRGLDPRIHPSLFVMAELVPAIHVLAFVRAR